MTEQPTRLSIEWAPEARADLRSIDRQTALEILHCIDRFLITRSGDVKRLKPPLVDFRLRCGDYRIFFKQIGEHSIGITAVRHRSRAYG